MFDLLPGVVGRFERGNVQRAMGNVVNKKIKIIKNGEVERREEINKKGGIDILLLQVPKSSSYTPLCFS